MTKNYTLTHWEAYELLGRLLSKATGDFTLEEFNTNEIFNEAIKGTIDIKDCQTLWKKISNTKTVSNEIYTLSKRVRYGLSYEASEKNLKIFEKFINGDSSTPFYKCVRRFPEAWTPNPWYSYLENTVWELYTYIQVPRSETWMVNFDWAIGQGSVNFYEFGKVKVVIYTEKNPQEYKGEYLVVDASKPFIKMSLSGIDTDHKLELDLFVGFSRKINMCTGQYREIENYFSSGPVIISRFAPDEDFEEPYHSVHYLEYDEDCEWVRGFLKLPLISKTKIPFLSNYEQLFEYVKTEELDLEINIDREANRKPGNGKNLLD